jgi:hypothetical protein
MQSPLRQNDPSLGLSEQRTAGSVQRVAGGSVVRTNEA